MSVDEFIRDFDDLMKHNTDLRIHFASQTQHYGTDPGLYTGIYKMKDLTKLKKQIETSCQVQLPDLHLQQSNLEKRLELQSRHINWITKKFSGDFEIYESWSA